MRSFALKTSQSAIRLTSQTVIHNTDRDRSQGFQVLVDDLTGFGSLSSATLGYLNEDFAKSPVFTCSVRCASEAKVGQIQKTKLIADKEVWIHGTLHSPLHICDSNQQESHRYWRGSAEWTAV